MSEDHIDEDIVNKLPYDDVTCATTELNFHDVELTQHHHMNEEGATNTNYERVIYTKLRETTSELITALLNANFQ